MRECLDEAMLQSYFDGELSTQTMERATLHLASCVICAAAARELEQETSVLEEAFALDFDAVVPTERLRRKVDAAVAGLHVVGPVAQHSGLAVFLSAISGFLTFSPQRTIGYASLALVLAAAGILGIVKLRTTTNNPTIAKTNEARPATTGEISGSDSVAKNSPTKGVDSSDVKEVEITGETPRTQRQKVSRRAVPKTIEPVRLLPGEKSYLQTIARLDSTIKSQTAMRPALQVEYERNLAVVDRAIAATRSAAKSNPNDPDAADFMFAAYQSKVDLLNTIADARLGGRSH